MECTRWSAASYVALWISLGSFVACLQPVWAQSNFRRGDSNVDADFDISDPIFTLSFLFVAGSAAPECRDAADSNDDGELDISDPIHSLSYLFASGGAPPAPFQVCGTDPTADELECVRFVVCPSVPPPSPTILPLERVTRDDAVEVSGTAEPGTSIEVVTGDQIVRGDAADGSYSLTVPLHENRLNRLFVTAVTFDGVRSAPATAQVTQDGQRPSVFIDFPAQSSQLPLSEVTVVGRVSDMLSGFMGLDVTVNGQAANVDIGIGTNGTFERADVPLVLGANLITVVATDGVGNQAMKSISVTRIEATGPRLEIVSGNNQSGEVQSTLADPLVVRFVEEDGTPVSDTSLVFRVKRSDGVLSLAENGETTRRLEMTTDAAGEASVFYKLGTDAGCGNNRVEVSAGQSSLFFCATATPSAPKQINIGSGNNQRGEAGGPAVEPLRVWVSDGCNGIVDQDVTFTVTRGSGTVNGAESVTVRTVDTGHAEVSFVLGSEPGNNVVEVNFPGNTTSPASFVIFGVERDQTHPTSFSGLVLDNSSQPLEGASCSLVFPGQEPLTEISDVNGQFRFPDVPGAGAAHLHVNGLSVNHLGGENGRSVDPGSFPALSYEVCLVPNAENSLPTPVLLPPLDPRNARTYDGTRTVELTVEGIEGLKMIVREGTKVTLLDGSIVDGTDGNSTTLALNQVHHDKVPMPMPDGAAPPYAGTLQPAGATFDPPVQIIYPNMSGLAPGSLTNFMSFNHDTERFEIIATGQVDEGGESIISDPGTGISVAGWHCNCPPYSVTGQCHSCVNDPQILNQIAQLKAQQLQKLAEAAQHLQDGSNALSLAGLPIAQAAAHISFVAAGIAACGARGCPVTVISCLACAPLIAPLLVDLQTLGPGHAFQAVSRLVEAASHLADAASSLGLALARAIEAIQLAAQIAVLCPPLAVQNTGEALRRAIEAVRNGTLAGLQAKINRLQPIASRLLRAVQAIQACLDSGLVSCVFSPFIGGGGGAGDQEIDDIEELVEYTESVIAELQEEFSSTDEELALVETGLQSIGHEFDQLERDLDHRNWLVSLAGQSIVPNDDGTFAFRNTSAPDLFGPGGPGSPPDFLSDDFIRVRATSTQDGVTRWAFSEPLQIRQGEIYIIGDLTFTDSPPLTNHSLTARALSPVLTAIDQIGQLEVTALLSDDTTKDVTSRTEWTVYRTSNPAIVSVGPDGLATANGPGRAIVTAVNEGATAVTRLLVAPGAATTIDGMVQLGDGTVVSGAMVSVVGQPISGTTSLDGSFEIGGVAAFLDRSLTLVARLNQGDSVLTGSVAGIESVPGGLTHAGLITLREAQTDSDGDGLPDEVETSVGLNPNSQDSDGDGVLDAEDDLDEDLLTNFEEFVIGTALNDEDTDSDGLVDGAEFEGDTDPVNYDTDGDKFSDGDEVADGSSPTDPLSLPPSLNVGVSVGQNFTIFNKTDPSKKVGIAVGPNFTVENLASPPEGAVAEENK